MESNCEDFPTTCINETFVTGMADAMEAEGLVAAGYTIISLDDGVFTTRDPTTNDLTEDKKRFPKGIKYLADYLHAKVRRGWGETLLGRVVVMCACFVTGIQFYCIFVSKGRRQGDHVVKVASRHLPILK